MKHPSSVVLGVSLCGFFFYLTRTSVKKGVITCSVSFNSFEYKCRKPDKKGKQIWKNSPRKENSRLCFSLSVPWLLAKYLNVANWADLIKQSGVSIKKFNIVYRKDLAAEGIWMTLLMVSHLVPQSVWYTCLQGNFIWRSPLLYPIWQITHLVCNRKPHQIRPKCIITLAFNKQEQYNLQQMLRYHKIEMNHLRR